jgi:hypothetical protein
VLVQLGRAAAAAAPPTLRSRGARDPERQVSAERSVSARTGRPTGRAARRRWGAAAARVRTAQAGGRAGTPAEQTLYEAASSGDVVEVRGLVALGVNVDERMRVWRRRSTARRNREGRVEVIKVLELGAKQGGE